MSEMPLKTQIIEALWENVDQHADILSATLTGSFVNSESLDGLSDIDLVVVVDELTRHGFEALQASFSASVQGILESAGYAFRLNPTLGPLKFNAPKLAVLHLMVYSQQAHIDHAVNSPFTCLDWQRSPYYRKQSIAEVYPVFGLQPHHFLSARRSISDYLKDFRNSVVSYRELSWTEHGFCEVQREKQMDVRDRHEFAYHVMRFLMLNVLKLVRKGDFEAHRIDILLDRFFEVFPDDEANSRALLLELAQKKRQLEYDSTLVGLNSRLEQFVDTFEQQFRGQFLVNASRHVAFRHAPTEMNLGPTRFVGRSDPAILEQQATCPEALLRAIEQIEPQRAFVSPLQRCRQSMERVWPARQAMTVDRRLVEIDYGQCEALTVSACQSAFPRLFEAWQKSEDPRFPNGESSADVTERVLGFAQEHWTAHAENSVVCTHNVVLKSLVGEVLGIPSCERYRLVIPHLTPIEFVATENFGVFVDMNADVERKMFSAFAA